ncbi:peptidase S8/S53 subtilisin kexin sedolisin [Thermoplasmatales archaeon SW_10_69_26]|nr:MAG: peptidase S8/S53 subtilisin kexin sedolisin [Thermoplasmatales archaeon SW_10_69_26]
MAALSSQRAALLVALVLLVPTASLAATGPDPAGPPVAAGDRWIVGFADLAAADVDDDEWRGHTVLDVNDAIGFAVVELEDPASFHLEDRHRDNVEYVEREDPTAYVTLFTPDDPRYDEQYGFPQIQTPTAWDTTLGSADVNVSVIDTGIDQDHEDLQNTVAEQRDFVGDDGTADDRCGHGTHVAGTVSANTDNGIGVAGTADGVNLFVAKALSDSLVVQCTGSSSDIADAITWSTDNGADVISMSLGSSSASSTIGQAVDYAWERGVLLVAAAGNDGQCSDCVGYPAARERVVAVTCTDSDRQQCSFSSQGPEAELAAPGDDILSTYNDGGYTQLDGTSMSTPHVSGAAGLALSVDPSLTNTELRDAMNTTARDLGDAGHDNEFGHGEVDAAALLDAVGGDTNEPPQASFTADCTELNCTFDASNATDADGNLTSYDWDLGDGTTATGEVVDHSYEAEGTYTVTLTVTDDEGTQDDATTDVTVSGSTSGAILEETFDDGAAQSFALSGLWHVTDACHAADSSPNHLAYTQDDTCTYDTGDQTNGTATFSVDTSDARSPQLAFEHRWETESTSCGLISCSGYDHMRVEQRTGDDWTTIAEWTSLDDNQPNWTSASYDLPADASLELRFVFDSRDSQANDYEGWFVDDVTVADAS